MKTLYFPDRRAFARGLALTAVLSLGLAHVREVASQTSSPAYPDDVVSVDAVIAATYASISGPAGAVLDADRFRNLFAAGARFIPTQPRPDGTYVMNVRDVDQFVQAVFEPRQIGFFEKEIARRTERFGNVVSVMSTYESLRTETDAAPFQRGVNSMQLMFDGTRWWMVSIVWDTERDGNPIPERYLPAPFAAGFPEKER